MLKMYVFSDEHQTGRLILIARVVRYTKAQLHARRTELVHVRNPPLVVLTQLQGHSVISRLAAQAKSIVGCNRQAFLSTCASAQ